LHLTISSFEKRVKEKDKKIPLKYLVYKKAVIRHPYKHASNIEKEL
jgi:hypothetical protein